MWNQTQREATKTATWHVQLKKEVLQSFANNITVSVCACPSHPILFVHKPFLWSSSIHSAYNLHNMGVYMTLLSYANKKVMIN